MAYTQEENNELIAQSTTPIDFQTTGNNLEDLFPIDKISFVISSLTSTFNIHFMINPPLIPLTKNSDLGSSSGTLRSMCPNGMIWGASFGTLRTLRLYAPKWRIWGASFGALRTLGFKKLAAGAAQQVSWIAILASQCL